MYSQFTGSQIKLVLTNAKIWTGEEEVLFPSILAIFTISHTWTLKS